METILNSKSDAVLTTKLYIPQARSNLVSRPRLMKKLDEGLGQKLTLISATAGFGKTTLLSEWTSRTDRAVAWLSLDEGDNDPSRFLIHLIAALQTIKPNLGEEAQALLNAARSPPVELILTSLINDIANDISPSTLVLEDYHLITAEPVHRALIFFLEHVPVQLNLVITSRADPPLPLSRFRGQGQLAEVRTDELRFTEAETERFLNQGMSLDLSADEISTLETRTEGWVVGLQLAAISLQKETNPSEFIKAFAGDNRYIIDYLLDEVFARQPQEIRNFLLQTAILDRLHGPLCDALLLQSGTSQEILERLEQANLFIVPLDNKRQWYRYHHLFGDLLRHRLQLGEQEQVMTLHKRAAAWYEEEGLTSEALKHLFMAEAFDWAAELIEHTGAKVLWERGEEATLLSWLQRLPQDLLYARPKLLLLKAWIMHLTGNLDAIEALLQSAEAHQGDDESDQLLGEVAVLRAFLARMKGDLPKAIELARQALARLPEGELRFRGLTSMGLAEAYFLNGELTAAGQLFEEASALCQEGNCISLMFFCLWRLAEVQMLKARLQQAANTCQRMEALAAETGIYIDTLDVIKGRLLTEWNDLTGAEAWLRKGIERGRQRGSLRVLVMGYLTLARVLQAQGKLEEAHELLQEAESLVEKHHITWTWGLPSIASCKVRLALTAGDTASAASWAEGLYPPGELSYEREADSFTLARVLLAEGKVSETTSLLERLLELARAGERTGRVIEALMLQALALQARGSNGEAVAALKKALALAEPQGYVRLFVDEGAPMQRLLRRAATRGVALEYVTKLLAAFSPARAPEPLSTPIEPLNERELEVLRLMSGRLSNKEIARELSLSLHTVKWYARSVYEKLGAHRRSRAVAKAKELGIL